MNMDQTEQLVTHLMDALPRSIAAWISTQVTERHSTPYLVLCEMLS